MRHLLALAFIAAALSACGGGGGAPDTPATAPTTSAQAQAPSPPTAEDCAVTLYGDSIWRGEFFDGAGQLQRLSEPPAATLARLLPGVAVVDRSVSGVSLHDLRDGYLNPYVPDGHARPPFERELRTTRVVVIGNGLVEAALQHPAPELADTVAALASVVATVRAEGRIPVVAGFPQLAEGPHRDLTITAQDLERRRETYAAFVRFTRDAGVLFADVGTAAFSGRADLVDGLHPSKPYSDRLTARLAAAVGIACTTKG